MTDTRESSARRLKHKRWSPSVIRQAAEIALQKGVVVRLEPDGAIVVMPAIGSAATDEDEEDSGLEKW